jgi:hypothetical protein
MKTLKSLYPEWQGCGEDNRAARGALAVWTAFAHKDRFVKKNGTPLWGAVWLNLPPTIG